MSKSPQNIWSQRASKNCQIQSNNFENGKPPKRLSDVMSEQRVEKIVNEQTEIQFQKELEIAIEQSVKISKTDIYLKNLNSVVTNNFEDESCLNATKDKYINEIDQSASATMLPEDLDTSNDGILAQMLQNQFNKDYNKELKECEKHLNKNGKITTSLKNFRINISDDESPYEDLDSSYSDDEYIDYDKGKTSRMYGKGLRFDKNRNEIVSKHDPQICYKENASKLNNFPLSIETGNTQGLSINNKIFNSLKVHAYEQKRYQARLNETKDRSTAEHAVDARSRLILHKWVNNGIIDEINGVISIGKEAVVLHAKGGPEIPSIHNHLTKSIPENVAIKVFKTTMGEFRNRDKYIKDDYRFERRFHKINAKKLAYLWAEKEMRNLERLHTSGINCPEVILLQKHILIMRFIGLVSADNGVACGAPKLNEILPKLKDSTQMRAFEETINIMKDMYNKAKLIHADLSPFNLLWHENKVWVIDTAQSVEPQHPKALEFLYRDVLNICKFFGGKLKLKIPNPRKLFYEICKADQEGVVVDDVFYHEFCFDDEENSKFLVKLEELEVRSKDRIYERRKGEAMQMDERYAIQEEEPCSSVMN